MTAEETEREPTDDQLAEYMDDPYVRELAALGDRLIVLSNSIDYEFPAEETPEPSPDGTTLATEETALLMGKSDEFLYVDSINAALENVEKAIKLRTRICFRHFPYEEHKKAPSKKGKARKKQ